MIELTAADFASVLPLLAGIKQKVLPYAICEARNPGRIFVDRRDNPQLAMLWSSVGYYFLAGDPTRAGDWMEIRRVLTDIFIPASRATGETGFILVPSQADWKDHLPTLLPGREIIEIYRRPFGFDPIQFTTHNNWQARIPQGFHLQSLDAALAEQVGILSSWASLEVFLQHGLGFALLDGDIIVSTCHSVFASRTHLEIDVHTAEKYQRQGYARLVTSAFIEECLKRGQQPNWECFWENDASNALAGKLCFTPEPDYPVWFWEE